MKNKYYHLKKILTKSIILTISIILAFSFFLIISNIFQIMSEEIEKNTISNFEKVEIEFNNVVNNSELIVQSIASDLAFKNYLIQNPTSYIHKTNLQINLQKLLSNLNRFNFNHFDFISIITDDRVVFSAPQSFKIFQADHLIIKDTLQNSLLHNESAFYFFSQNVFSLRATETLTSFCFVKKISMNNSSVIFVLGIRENKFKNVFRGLQQEDNFVYLVDDSGKIVSSFDDTLLGDTISFKEELSLSSFTTHINSKEFQIISKPFANTNWSIVNQYPTTSYKKDIYAVLILIFIILISSLFLIYLFIIFLLYKFLTPISTLSDIMKNFIPNRTHHISIPKSNIVEFNILSKSFQHMATNIDELILFQKAEEKRKNDLRLQNLMAQINPHFIHNTLNNVKVMAMVESNDNVVAMLNHLINYIKPSFRAIKGQWTFAEENDFLKDYLYILNIRFAGNVNISMSFDKNLNSHILPQFIIQPLIENCITHSFIEKKELSIDITAKIESDNVIIKVCDNGKGIDAATVSALQNRIDNFNLTSTPSEKTSIGLTNIKHRLHIYFPGTHNISIQSIPNQKTEITVTFSLDS